MADTTAATGLTAKQWDDKFFTEYLSENRFKREMGTSTSSIIQVKEDLMKNKGDTLHFALANKLTGNGVTGSSTLEGNEEALDTRSFALTIQQRRNATRVSAWDEQKSSIDLRNACKAALKDWAMEDTRDRIIEAMGSVNGVAYGSATEAQKDAWVDGNLDRVLFGDAKSNVATTSPAGGATKDHSASLAAVTGSMTLGTAEISLLKRMAQTASPKIRPVRDTLARDGRRYYVLYVHPLAMRDLKADTALQQAQREVSLTPENSRLFEGGDVLWDGVIVKEIEDIPVLSEVGASSIDLAPAYFCGAQALGYGIAKRWKSVTEIFDYGDKYGCAIGEMGNIAKLTFGTGSSDTDDQKDHGIVTGFFPAVADA
jgi:N4-gp56 family major capsid protein